MPETYNTYVQLHINSHISITHPVVKIEIANWKYMFLPIFQAIR